MGLTECYTVRIIQKMTGDELRAVRKRLEKTQKQLADLVGVSGNTIARYERDEVGISEPLSRFVTLLEKTMTVEGSQRIKKRK